MMSDIDEALVALSELFIAAWRGGHCHPEEASKRRAQIEAALERQRMFDALVNALEDAAHYIEFNSIMYERYDSDTQHIINTNIALLSRIRGTAPAPEDDDAPET